MILVSCGELLSSVLQRARHTHCRLYSAQKVRAAPFACVPGDTTGLALSLSLSLFSRVGLHLCCESAAVRCVLVRCVLVRGTPAHSGVRHKAPDPLEQWAQTSEKCPSDSARVRGANQAPGTRSRATALVVDTAGLLRAQGQRGIKWV